jgi:tRNA(fMet)-specific endonuclease VapC
LAYLIDTGIAIDLRDRRETIVDALEQLPSIPSLSVLSLAELEGGVYAKPELTVTRREGLTRLVELLTVIDLTKAIANAYGHIVEAQGFNRRKIIDRMIAATAIVHDLTLITSNGADFADIDGLMLLVWDA